MLFDKKFDLVISIGEDCACSSYLRRFNLQDFSYPFDWLTAASFKSRIEMIVNDFRDFLNYDNLAFLPKPENKLVDKNCDYYEDKVHGYYFYHDFKAGVPLSESYTEVKQKYNRRIKRFYKNINRSRSILFVWWGRGKNQRQDDVIEAYEQLTKKFKHKNIYLLLLETGNKHKTTILKDNHIIKKEYDNLSYLHNPDWDEVMGNQDNNMEIYGQISRSHPFSWHFKHFVFFVMKLAIGLIPIKKIRKKLRDNLKNNLFKVKL